MAGDEDELLASELGDLGGPGSAWAARRFRVDVHEIEISAGVPADEVLQQRAGRKAAERLAALLR